MRSFNLLLDSSLAKRQRNNLNQNSHDFKIFFEPPINLDPRKNYKAVLNKLITMSYSWYNIPSVFGNNKILWRIKLKRTENWQTLTFPDGMYRYSDINSFLQTQTGRVDPADEDIKHIFTLYFNMTIYRVVTLIQEDYELDLSSGDFAKLLGFPNKIFAGATSFVGEKIPDITCTRSVDWAFLHCDLITRQANDVGSGFLSSFSTADLQGSYPFQNEP